MSATSIDLSQIKTDALSAASTFRTLIGLGTSATLNAGSANGVATLGADSKLTASQIPDISLISYLGSVASQAAMLALTGQQGDWCVRSDLSTTWVITGSDPTQIGNWTQLSYPSVPVQSVFGRTGNVVGVSTDYSSVGITNTAIGATNPSTGAFTTLSANSATLSAGTLNGTVLDIAQTWGGTGTYTGLKYNVTDSGPSNAASLLMDLQVGGVSRLSLSKSGNLNLYWDGSKSTISRGPALVLADDGNHWFSFVRYTGFVIDANYGAGIHFSSGGSAPSGSRTLSLWRDANDVFAQRNGANAQTFRLYRTADGSPGSNYERLALSSTTYSSAVYQTILCESGGTGAANINLVLGPKGTGAILAQVPDGTATGGNARGQYAVDLQTVRTANTQVASGNYSFVCGGGSTSAGLYSVVFGESNNVTSAGNNGAVVGGTSNEVRDWCTGIFAGRLNVITGGYYSVICGGIQSTISTSFGFIGGGNQNNVSGLLSVAFGNQGNADRRNQLVFGAGQFSAKGDAQKVEFVLRVKTTDATATSLRLGDDTTRLTIPSGKVFAFVAKISGIKSDGSAVAFYTRKGAIKNVGGTTSLVGSIETIGTDTEDNASTDVAITADDTNDALQINVTGIASETWRWVAVVEGVEIGYGT